MRIDGLAQAGATVTLYDGSTVVGQATADAKTGAFSILASAALSNGMHALTATATTAAGTSALSGSLSVLVDTHAPAGSILGGHVFQSGSSEWVALSGTSSEPVAGVKYSVDVLQDNSVVGTVTPDANGIWSFTQQVSDAPHSYSIKIADTADNVSTGADSLTLAALQLGGRGGGHGHSGRSAELALATGAHQQATLARTGSHSAIAQSAGASVTHIGSTMPAPGQSVLAQLGLEGTPVAHANAAATDILAPLITTVGIPHPAFDHGALT